MSIKDEIHRKIVDSLQPEHIEIINESHLHQGHAGWDGTGNSHFRIRLTASRFNGLGRIARHRLVHEALTPAPMDTIHALALELTATDGS
ncbi:MAG: BolA family transcriptional regulator [Rhodobacteraceae bacterium]|nr:BolA family transcriptional regulator [Paracoccaceae bacterium]